MSNITLNIVEPGSAPVVPDTGLFTAGIGGSEATIITAVSTVLLLTIVAVVVAMLYKKHKKQGKATKLVSTVDACAAIVKSKKCVSAGLAAVALLVSAGTFAGLLVNAGKSNTNAAEDEDGLTLDVSSEDLTIEVADEPVFAVLPVELTVEEATEAGYTLTAYTDNTDLVSTTDESKVIPMVTVEGDELVALTDNTYGLALAEPASQAEEVYITLSTDADAPTFITDKDHKATEAGDTTTIYYGFFITPDVPYGTYTGSDIYYDAEVNYTTTLTFDGNDSDGGEEMESIIVPAGDSTTLPPNTYTRTDYEFVGWNTNAAGTGQDYADGAKYTAVEGEFAEVTLYAQWEYNGPCVANHICYRGNGASTATDMDNVEQYTTGTSTGKQVDLLASNFTKAGHGFVGWSEDKDAWTHLTEEGTAIPTIYGPNQTITVGDLSEEGMKLYAIWAPVETTASGKPVELQNWNGCSALDITTYSNGVFTVGKNTVTALKDSRDGNVYTVARLADGNCWMVENLRIADTHVEDGITVSTTITTDNTHSPITVGDNVAIMNNDGNTSAHLSPSLSQWCTSGDETCLNQSNLNTNNVANTAISPAFSQDFTSSAHGSGFDGNIASYGNYYNWYSATAGNGIYDKSSGNTNGDICPKGWHLPTGGSNGEFNALNQQMGGGTSATDSNNWRSFPNNFVYSGTWEGSSARGRGYNGFYWSSTASNNDGAYNLYLSSGNVYPATNYSKYYGVSVRCVAPGQ